MTTLIAAPAERDTPNFDRMDGLIAWAEVEYAKRLAGLPSEWDQDTWVDTHNAEMFAEKYGVVLDEPCGTVCCLAGRVGMEDGVLEKNHLGGFTMATVVSPVNPVYEGQKLYVGDYAALVLGIDGGDDADLFHGKNGLGDLKRIRDEYADEHGVLRRYSEDEYDVDSNRVRGVDY